MKADVRTTATPDAFFISSPSTTVRIDRASGRVTFHDPNGNLILSELKGVDNSGDVKTVTFAGDMSEAIYGSRREGAFPKS